MHDAPDKDWTLEWLADTAGMSRTSFANVFRDVIGVTPGNYLSRWRLTLAKGLLSEGAPLKGVARAVGYASPAALSRAYTRQFGLSPRESKHHNAPRMAASG
jgi:transcriptional regulator GlxA family with amidase domain